ncbi:MAG: flagellar hook protein FlgE, partial [Gammaproteobacteria bacterium]|nr:flagellar hook protein FlgE [Gammaproteobacteria bacterium]NIR95369.1 flagellar hook protein FlgE [Gammaproteobacteria bacterium]
FDPDLVTFDGAGRMQAINGIPVPPGKINYPDYVTDTGSAPMMMSLDLMGATPTTQYGGKFDVNALVQDGY